MNGLGNLKFRVNGPEQSKELQRVLFELSFRWVESMSNPTPLYVGAPYLYVEGDTDEKYRIITYSDAKTDTWFKSMLYEEQDTEQFIKQHTKETMKESVKLVPRKHAELIILWANGAEIEFESTRNGWLPTNGSPTWCSNTNYRVKPIPKRVFPATSLSGAELYREWAQMPGGALEGMVRVANKVIRQHILDSEKA